MQTETIKRILGMTMMAGATAMLVACGGTDPGDDNQGPGDPGAIGEEAASSLSRDLSPDVAAETVAELAAGNREFAFEVMRTIREEDEDEEVENLFLSPHSISLALAMTYAGAVNNTEAEMAEALRFTLPQEELHPAFNALDLELATRAEFEREDPDDEGQSFTLDIVNQTWGHYDFDFQAPYLDTIAVNYGAGIRLVDFVTNFEEIRLAINAWVEEQTRDRIQDLLPPNSLTETTRFVLVNAIYFYGSWDTPFNADATSDQPFQRLDGSTVDVPMMNQGGMVRYAETDHSLAVSIPYVGEQVSMVAFMPLSEEDDFETWEDALNHEEFDALARNLSLVDGQFHLPRFESESTTELKDVLKAMGMVEAFERREADFEGITGVGPGIDFQSLYISDIFHKTFVSVDEEGTEAAAATAVVMGTPTSAPLDPIDVRFDRPFYYAIYDHPTETVLFLGRMVDPS